MRNALKSSIQAGNEALVILVELLLRDRSGGLTLAVSPGVRGSSAARAWPREHCRGNETCRRCERSMWSVEGRPRPPALGGVAALAAAPLVLGSAIKWHMNTIIGAIFETSSTSTAQKRIQERSNRTWAVCQLPLPNR